MKRALTLSLMVAAFAHGAWAAVPTSAEGWYTPAKFDLTTAYGTVMYLDEETGLESAAYIIMDEEGNFSEVEGSGASRSDVLSEASKNALQALVRAQRNTERISTIGKNLHDLTQKTGIEVTNENTGQKFTIKFNGSIASASAGSNSGNIPATSDADDPADKKSLDWTDDTASAKLQIKGFNTAKSSSYFIPHPIGGELKWSPVSTLADNKTIEATYDPSKVFDYTFGLKNWISNYSGDAPLYVANEKGVLTYREIKIPAPDEVSVASNASGKVEIKGWKTAEGCSEKLSELLTDSNSSTQRELHQIVVRYGTGDSAVIHYLPIGDALPKPLVPDGKSVVTNETDNGSLSLAGAADQTIYMIPQSDGNGGLTWDYVPKVTYDAEGFKLEILDHSQDDETKTVYLPRISISSNVTDKATDYTITWRDVGDSADLETTIISVPIATNATGVAAVDGVTVVTNATGHANEIALSGFWDSGTTDGMFPVKSGGALVWMPTNVVSVTTNKVDGDKITITSTEANGEKTLGLKDWDAGYGGSFPLFLVNDRGALRYYPLPEPITNEWDNASVASNAQRKIEIKGFADGTPRCGANLYAMLTNTATAYPDKADHMILSRYKHGDEAPILHWIPFPEDALVTDGGTGAMEVDGVTIVTNTSQGAATQGMASIAGYWTAKKGTVLTRTADGVTWTNSAVALDVDEKSLTTNYTHGAVSDGTLSICGYRTATEGQFLARTADGVTWTNSAVALDVDGKSVTTNESSKISLYGFDGAAANAIPHKENGVLVWGGISAVTNTILAGAGINITDNGGGAITISAQAMTQESGGEVTVSVVTDARYDPATHKFQVKRRQLVFTGSLGPESAWTDVFETVSHQSEHEIEEH